MYGGKEVGMGNTGIKQCTQLKTASQKTHGSLVDLGLKQAQSEVIH